MSPSSKSGQNDESQVEAYSPPGESRHPAKAEDINSFDVRPAWTRCEKCDHPTHEGRMCGNALTKSYPELATELITGVCRCGGLQKCPHCNHYHVREDGWYVRCETCESCFITVPDL